MQDEVERKLAAARTRLILDKPFLGALVLRLPMVEANPDWCPTSATDARKFYYNREYVERLSVGQVQFVLAHEAMHCALSHFARRQHRDKYRWDVACDYAVNPLLLNDDLEPPPGVLVQERFEGMTAEEIYPCIDNTDADEPMDRHVYDNDEGEGSGNDGPAGDKGGDRPPEDQDPSQDPDESDGGQSSEPDDGDPSQGGEGEDQERGASQPPPLSTSEQEALAVQWQQRLAGAAQQAMQAGKLGAAMARLVDHLLQPQLPWRMLLARYMTAAARDDYSYQRPSQRREGPAIMPSLRSSQVEVAVAIDTSGSIGQEEIAEFMAEVDAIKGQVRARVVLLACDAELAEDGPWVFEPWEELRAPEALAGGGGTRFDPVFEWLEAQDQQPGLLVYFTDAIGHFPKIEPSFPTVWLVKGRGQVPWGQRIQLN
jgi:predicted metal-dependent peptidase